MIQKGVSLQTTDGVTIVSDWSLPPGGAKSVLLLHMMPATRVSYAPLTKTLNEVGFATLTIDLRGHGESIYRKKITDNRQRLDYQNFSDAEHQASRLDIDAAMNFLKEKGFTEENIAFVGASIGANLALDAMYRYNGTQRGVLLSPGLDYRGLQTEPLIKNLSEKQKVWIVAAESDEYSAKSTKILTDLRPDIANMTLYKGSEHGTNLFAAQQGLIPNIIKFLSS